MNWESDSFKSNESPIWHGSSWREGEVASSGEECRSVVAAVDHVETVPYALSNLSTYWQPGKVFESASTCLRVVERGLAIKAILEPDLGDCMKAIAAEDARSNEKQIAELGSKIEGLSVEDVRVNAKQIVEIESMIEILAGLEDCMRVIAAEDALSNLTECHRILDALDAERDTAPTQFRPNNSATINESDRSSSPDARLRIHIMDENNRSNRVKDSPSVDFPRLGSSSLDSGHNRSSDLSDCEPTGRASCAKILSRPSSCCSDAETDVSERFGTPLKRFGRPSI